MNQIYNNQLIESQGSMPLYGMKENKNLSLDKSVESNSKTSESKSHSGCMYKNCGNCANTSCPIRSINKGNIEDELVAALSGNLAPIADGNLMAYSITPKGQGSYAMDPSTIASYLGGASGDKPKASYGKADATSNLYQAAVGLYVASLLMYTAALADTQSKGNNPYIAAPKAMYKGKGSFPMPTSGYKGKSSSSKGNYSGKGAKAA